MAIKDHIGGCPGGLCSCPDDEHCVVCGRKLSPNGHCRRCLEIKALARDPGFYNVMVVLGDGLPLPKLDDGEK